MRRLRSRQWSGVVSQQRLRPKRFDSAVKRVRKLKSEPFPFLFFVCFSVKEVMPFKKEAKPDGGGNISFNFINGNVLSSGRFSYFFSKSWYDIWGGRRFWCYKTSDIKIEANKASTHGSFEQGKPIFLTMKYYLQLEIYTESLRNLKWSCRY